MILIRRRGDGRWAAVFLLLALAQPANAELYEWTDDEGRVHYSNEPRPGSDKVGLAPLALDPVGGEDETPTDATRRDRLKRQHADRQLDSQDELPTQAPNPVWSEPEGSGDARPAAPAPDAEAIRERECQRLHGMSCLRYQAWRQTREVACRERASGEGCPPNKDAEQDSPSARGPEIPRPSAQDAWPVGADPHQSPDLADEPD